MDKRDPLLVKVGMAHAQFETIHPFLDGNGRVGRLLVAFLLCEQGVLAKPVLYLSHYLKQHRDEYYTALQRIRDDGDWEGWMEFFLRGVHAVSDEAVDTARRILTLRERLRDSIAESLGRATNSAHRTLELLFEKPIVSTSQIVEDTGISYAAANNSIAKLKTLGIVEEITGNRRNRRFAFKPYIALFSD